MSLRGRGRMVKTLRLAEIQTARMVMIGRRQGVTEKDSSGRSCMKVIARRWELLGG